MLELRIGRFGRNNFLVFLVIVIGFLCEISAVGKSKNILRKNFSQDQ